MKKFEHVFSNHHQMSLAGVLRLRGLRSDVGGRGVGAQTGGPGAGGPVQ